MKSAQEVEIKYRLPDRDAYNKFLRTWAESFRSMRGKLHYTNYFFDGVGDEISAARETLRLRIDRLSNTCYVTHKTPSTICDGVSRVAAETEEPLSRKDFERVLSDPSALLSLPNDIVVNHIKKVHPNLGGLKLLGQYDTTRLEFDFGDGVHKLELDHVTYTFGELFEIEVETADPEAMSKCLGAMLDECGVPYTPSTKSKAKRLADGKLDD